MISTALAHSGRDIQSRTGDLSWFFLLAPTDDAEDRSVRFDTETNVFSVPLSDPAGCRLYVWWSRESTDALRFELTAALANFTTSGIPAHLAQGAKVLYDPGEGEPAEVALEQFIEGVRQVVMGAGLPVEVA